MIELKKVHLQAGKHEMRDISFRVEAASYAMLMGRTGSGKTTILEAICGLRQVKAGSIHIAGSDVTNLPPGAREIGYVPQDGALFPSMTVEENLTFALRLRHAPAAVIRERTEELADILQIGHLLARSPVKLSGGEAQRVALGRAIAFRPKILLLDEPLSALDDATRSEMYSLLRSVQTRFAVTTLHVTHSNDEAEQLGDVRLLLGEHGVEQPRTARAS